MVLQDTWLFEGTIRDNIAYGRPDATEEEILEAARATFVDRFVHSLPDGYDTVIDEEGSNLSAGERQLVTIARAFLTDPALLILDEATSSVDTRTELLVQHAMAALRTDRTSFVIAHRLSTIRDADLILVMEDGAIVEQGTHEGLLGAGRGLRPALQRAVHRRRSPAERGAQPSPLPRRSRSRTSSSVSGAVSASPSRSVPISSSSSPDWPGVAGERVVLGRLEVLRQLVVPDVAGPARLESRSVFSAPGVVGLGRRRAAGRGVRLLFAHGHFLPATGNEFRETD